MAYRNAGTWNPFSPGTARPACDPVGIWERSGDVDVPDADRARGVNPQAASRSPGTQALDRLIGTIAAGRATELADHVIAEFGTSAALLSATPARLDRALSGNRPVVELLLAARDLMLLSLGEQVDDQPLLADGDAVRDYLFAHMAYEPTEQVRTLYLDTRNRLLRDQLVASGSVNRVNISPREIVRRAMDVGATGMILAHNHPSGDPTPSKSDILITREIRQAADLFELRLHDHIIIGKRGWYSFRAAGLM